MMLTVSTRNIRAKCPQLGRKKVDTIFGQCPGELSRGGTLLRVLRVF